MVAVLTGRLGDGASVTVTSGDALVLADQVQARVDERKVREDLGMFPRCQPLCGSIARAYSGGLA